MTASAGSGKPLGNIYVFIIVICIVCGLGLLFLGIAVVIWCMRGADPFWRQSPPISPYPPEDPQLHQLHYQPQHPYHPNDGIPQIPQAHQPHFPPHRPYNPNDDIPQHPYPTSARRSPRSSMNDIEAVPVPHSARRSPRGFVNHIEAIPVSDPYGQPPHHHHHHEPVPADQPIAYATPLHTAWAVSN
eukprot:scaffold4399_cov175-Ochromonas_danica.AAC.18